MTELITIEDAYREFSKFKKQYIACEYKFNPNLRVYLLYLKGIRETLRHRYLTDAQISFIITNIAKIKIFFLNCKCFSTDIRRHINATINNLPFNHGYKKLKRFQ